MKNEKLELLLNKVVEYNDPKAYSGKGCHFKAFLYKYPNGDYYFKVVEVMAGTDLAFNDIIPLQEGDENYLVVADKPKLMRVSRKSWHYQLMKYILKDSTPTPRDMQNGCPYFWLLVFSIIVTPFKLLYVAVKSVLLLIPKMLFWVLKQMVESWVAGLDDEAAYDMYWGGGDSKMPKTAKIFFNNSDDGFFEFFLSKKYKEIGKDDPNYEEKRQEIKAKWSEWKADLDKRRAAQREETQKKNAILEAKKREHDRKHRESQERWDARMEPIHLWFENTGDWFKKTFTVQRGRVNQIVKRTKQFLGAILTLLILALTFVVVNYTSLLLMVIADLCIANWVVFVWLGVIAVSSGIVYLLYILISSWGQAVVNKYRRGKRVWYIEPFIYLVWFPLKYTAIAIAFIVVKIIWEIIKFVFYTVLFRYFLKPIGLFIAKLAVGLIKGIGSSSGIFGEYFGASYSDYCPGIEWTDFDDE